MEIELICGRIGRDAVMGPNGKQEYVQFTVACDRYVGKENGGDERGLVPAWYTVFGHGERFTKRINGLKKGNFVAIAGRFTDNVYESKKTGNCEVGRTIHAYELDIATLAPNTPTEDERMPKLEPKAEQQPAPAPKPTKSVATEPDDDLPF